LNNGERGLRLRPALHPASLASLKNAANDAYAFLENADGCKYDIEVKGRGFSASVTVDHKGAVTLSANPGDEIELTTHDQGRNGFDKVFQVKGAVLEIIHADDADDAYDSVILKDAQGVSLTCEIDY
jgi:hypothetical protein